MSDQLALSTECCKFRDCPGEVVGSSITGEGKVCAFHNTLEWGRSLTRPHQPLWIRRHGLACLAAVAPTERAR